MSYESRKRKRLGTIWVEWAFCFLQNFERYFEADTKERLNQNRSYSKFDNRIVNQLTEVSKFARKKHF